MSSLISPASANATDDSYASQEPLPFFQATAAMARRWRLLLGAMVCCAAAGYGASYLMTPTFTARTSFLSPQPQQNSAAAALASLGALSGLSGAGAPRTQADQYVTLLQSATLSDRMIERFDLVKLYESKYRSDARRELADHVRITLGKKDSLIVVEVDDHSPERAAEMANAYIDELKKFANAFSLTEAQQRRAFFEKHLSDVRNALTESQTLLAKTGFDAGALKGELKTAAETFAKTKAEIAAAEVQIGALSKTLTDNAPEMQRARARLAALTSQLRALERPANGRTDQDYLGAYRDFKYQEALFEIYARQFELARLDEARDGALIQVVDVASPPERRSKPRRMIIALLAALGGLLLAGAWVMARDFRSIPALDAARR